MPQLNKGDTFADGQQVTGVRLNGLVDNATVLPGLITDQTNITANTVASGDSVLLHDLSATALREATVGDLLNSGLAITTGSVTGNAGADVVITPAATYKVDVAGPLEADDVNVVDDLTVGDDATVSGDLAVTGGSTLTGNVVADAGFTCNGTANFTGALQVNGTVGYVLTEIVEEDIPYAVGATANTLHNLFTSASYTKLTGEVWVIEVNVTLFTDNNSNVHYRVTDSSDSVNHIIGYYVTNSAVRPFQVTNTAVIGSSSTYTGSFVFRTKCSQPNIHITPTSTNLASFPDGTKGSIGKFRIYKYKTA
jgi:hypothetical protein